MANSKGKCCQSEFSLQLQVKKWVSFWYLYLAHCDTPSMLLTYRFRKNQTLQFVLFQAGICWHHSIVECRFQIIVVLSMSRNTHDMSYSIHIKHVCLFVCLIWGTVIDKAILHIHYWSNDSKHWNVNVTQHLAFC